MTVYIDLLILVNFLRNYFLIKLTAMISGSETRTARLITASLIGSIFSLSIFADMGKCISIVYKILSVTVCSILSFGYKSHKYFLKRTAVLMAVYMMFTGLLILMSVNSSYIFMNNYSFYISINPILFVGIVVRFYIIFSVAEFIFCSHPYGYMYNLVLCTDYGNLSAHAFYDTGFRVKDIMGFDPVIMCSIEFLKKSGCNQLFNIINDFYNGQINTRIKPLFYSDITGQGMLPAVKIKNIILKKDNNLKEVKNILLAVSNKSFSDERDIIFGKEFYDRICD